MIVKKINIQHFRSFNNVNIPLSKGVTVIAGQNGCGKSTLLGMLAQPFNFVSPKELEDFFGFKVKSEFSEIFKISPDKDIPGEHIYFLELEQSDLHPEGNNIQVKSYARNTVENGKIIKDPNRPSTFIRFVTGKKRKKDDSKDDSGGNINNVPVIYLDLSRLEPIGKTYVKTYNRKLTDKEEKRLIEMHKNILKLNHIKVKTENVQGLELNSKKISVGYENERYDAYANSAGQDNLDKILLAMLYIWKIKQKLGAQYIGAFLLIDEVDATLFPAAQEELIKEMVSFCQSTDAQIVVTTHSQNILKYIVKKYENKEDLSKLIYLKSKNNQGEIEVKENPSWEYITNDLNLTRSDKKDLIKVNIFREDDVTEKFIKKILGPKIVKHLRFMDVDLGHGSLKTLSNGKDSFFDNAIYVVDGEVKDLDMVGTKHTLRLPGEDTPENCIYKCIFNTKDNDDIWNDEIGYSKQKCFEHCSDINAAKDWFRALSNIDKNKFIKRWKQSLTKEIEDWKNKFIELYNEQADKIGADKI